MCPVWWRPASRQVMNVYRSEITDGVGGRGGSRRKSGGSSGVAGGGGESHFPTADQYHYSEVDIVFAWRILPKYGQIDKSFVLSTSPRFFFSRISDEGSLPRGSFAK